MGEGKGLNDGVNNGLGGKRGKVGGQRAGLPLLLLTTTGAKTGCALTKPLACTKDGDRIFVIASFAGSPNNPAWFNNLVSNPTVTVEVGSERFQARGVVTTGEERQRLFNTQADKIPIFHDYQKKTARQIPVVAFERIS